jgi:hypothetical protein
LTLPDPRRYGGGIPNALAQLAARDSDADALRKALAECLAHRRDAQIGQALSAAASRDQYVRLWNAVCRAVETPPHGAGVVTRVFAMPWVLVCGTRQAACIPCVLADVGAVMEVLESRGALGLNRNVGFANALCDAQALEAFSPGLLYEWMRGAGTPPDCPPAPIRLAPGSEAVHLRFLPGAAVTPVHEPGVVETAAHIGGWGMDATRVLRSQLAVPGVELLPLPRPPAGIMRASYAGRRAALEIGFNLFLSNSVRSSRTKSADPVVVVSAHENGELRITLRSPLDEDLAEVYRWPLHPLDDIGEIAASVADFAGECRLPPVQFIADVLPDRTATGATFLPKLETPASPRAGHH